MPITFCTPACKWWRADMLPQCLLILTTTYLVIMPVAFPKPPKSPVQKFLIPNNIPKCPTFSSGPIQTWHKKQKVSALAATLECAWEKKPASGLSSKLRAREHDQSRVLLNIYVFLLMQIISVNPAEGFKSLWGVWSSRFWVIADHCEIELEVLAGHFHWKLSLNILAGNLCWTL